MINVIVLCLILLLLRTHDRRQYIGWLVSFYYLAFIAVEVIFVGLIGGASLTFEEAVLLDLTYALVSVLVMALALVIYIKDDNRLALLYSLWIFFNICLSGASASFHAYESGMFEYAYNVVQIVNIAIDLTVVILGTDNIIRRTKYVSSLCNYISNYVGYRLSMVDQNSNRDQ